MEGYLLDLAKNEVQSLVNLVKNEAQYLCCFNSYVENFDQKKEILTAKHQDVKRKFQKGKGVFSFKSEAQQWVDEADGIIHIDTKIKKRFFFGQCPNYWWQYRRGKELAQKTQHIEKLLARCNSNIVAGRANVSNIKHLSSQDFINFKSRELKFQDLMKALQEENCNMVGLYGMGGAGKTSMAKEVGHRLKESKLIDKFIFLVVSKPPNFKKIRGELAKGLDLNLEDVNEEEHLNTILSRITNMDEKLLITLDDVWEKFDLTENLGIPSNHQHKGYSLLITTRNLRVCTEMGFQTIELQTLTDEESLNFFLSHASISSSSRGLKGIPQKIVKQCGGVPVAIVAIARALKNQPTSVWKDALKALEDRSVDQNLEEAYKCLKLSYDNLKNKKAKELLLISSLFPEDYEIPIQLLIEIGIGLGSYGENDKYHLERSEVHRAIMELIDSSLLLIGEEECVKMHDLVHEVALWIGDKDIQSLVDSKMPIKENLKYLFWCNDHFPGEFDGNKLEVLFIFLYGPKDFNVSDTFFKEMVRLRVVALFSLFDKRIPTLSLMNSLQTLKDIQTLILMYLKLGDISTLGNLLNLGTLWFNDCSIIELPREFLKLKKLRSLELRRCVLEKNNPFKVIERCSTLEELTFVGNKCDNEEKDAISQIGSPLTLHRYCISSEDDFSDYFEEYGSMSRCFQIDGSSHLVSDATFKQLAERAELLILEGMRVETIWNNDLIVLHLTSCPDMQCLVDTKDHDSGVTALCNLAELHLCKMDVEDLCRDPPSSGFLEQLEIMNLKECHRLKSILSNANFNLCHLKSMELEDCPKLTSIFQPSTARSLMQLKELIIRSCSALEYIIVGEDGDSNRKSYYDSLFPSLKELELSEVPSFIGIFREHHQLIRSSVQKPSPPLSRQNSNSINQSSATRAFSWVQACCSLNISRPTNEETNITVSEHRSADHTNPLGLLASKEWIDTASTLVRQLVLHVRHIREMKLAHFSLNSRSTLFTLSIASMISWEELTITNYDGLKHLVTSEEDDYKDQINCISIFPKLQKLEIGECKDLEVLFLSTMSIDIKNLKSLTIKNAPKLTYVIGKHQHHHCISNQNQNDELHFDLLALEALCFEDIPNFISIGPMNYKMVSRSLQSSDEGQLNLNTTKELHVSTNGAPLFHAAQSLIQSLKNMRKLELVYCVNLASVSTLSVASTVLLEDLTIKGCGQLKCIVADEGDAGTHMNSNSIFPKLKLLQVSNCDSLEYLFPAYAFRSPLYLESLEINVAPKLKYVFGRSHHEDILTYGNHNIQTDIDFPALKNLSLSSVPELVSIYPENYYLRELSLMSITLGGFPEFTMRPFNESFVNRQTKQQESKISGCSLCVGPKCIMCFHSVQELFITACKKLKVIFSVPAVRSLPMLKVLCISDCEELVHILEEDDDTNADDHLRHEPCFPNLEYVSVEKCDKLKYLFSITIYDILPKLSHLWITKAYELEHLLIIRGVMREMVMRDVFPRLLILNLVELPNLVSICHGIDFQTFMNQDDWTKVVDCPKFSFYESSTSQLQESPETTDSQVEEKVDEKPSSHLSSKQSLNMGEATQQSLTKDIQEATEEIVEEDSISEMAKMTISSSDSKLTGQLLVNKEVNNEGILMDPSVIGTENITKVIEARAEEGASSETLYYSSLTFEKGADNGDIKEAGKVQNESKWNVEPSNLTQREQESSYSKDSQSTRAMPTTPFLTISQDESSKIVEVRAEEGASLETPHLSSLTSKKEPFPKSPNPTVLPRSPSTTAKIFEEEEKGDPFVPPTSIISNEQTSETILPLSLILSKALTSPKRTPMSTFPESTYGKNIQENVGTTNPRLHEDLCAVQISSQLAECDSLNMAPFIYDTNNALSVAGVKEIVGMMKLEGVEPSMLAEAFKTNPQLHLSSKDRSTELLCYSYRVLLNILNILATRSPFTITKADKTLLAKYLKDASILGFDKDWLESIKIKVFNCDALDVRHKQQVLKSLGDKLQANKRELAIVHDQEVKAAQSVEMAQKELEATHKELEVAYKGLEAAQSQFSVAQQEHANIRVRHSQLLEECHEILEQRDQCSEIIAAKLRPFGF